jgi:hypothetical protein
MHELEINPPDAKGCVHPSSLQSAGGCQPPNASDKLAMKPLKYESTASSVASF